MTSLNQCHVGLLGAELAEWGGGWDLLRLIAGGFAETGARVTLLIPQATWSTKLRKRLGVYKRAAASICRLDRPTFQRTAAIDFPRMIESVRTSGCDFDVVEYASSGDGLARAVAEQGIDVLMPCMRPPGSNLPADWIGYIPDMQHKYLPQFFSHAEMDQRDWRFQQLLRESTVIVNSQQANADLEKYYDVSNCEIVVLPFTPLPQPEWLTGDLHEVRARYSLPSRYFLISNQFWQHKDHATAFKALSLLRSRDVAMICTGNTSDYRAPEYFASLERLVGKLGIKDRVRFLGHIPKNDQMTIMRDAVAVVQPTLFEGGPGGGSVYDAVGIGTPAIVSDIDVNREISDKGVTFFRVGSVHDLAGKLKEALVTPQVCRNSESLLARAEERKARLAAALTRAVELAMRFSVVRG